MRKPIFLSAPSCATAAFMYCSAMLSVIWKQMRSGLCVPVASWVLSHSAKPVSSTLSRDRRTNRQPGFALRRERQRCADHPAIDVLEQVVAFGGGHEFRGQHFLALVIEHAHQHVEHVRIFALQARHRLLHEAEAVLHERRLDVLDPDLVVGLHARVGVGLVEMEDLVAALAAAAAHGFDDVGDDRVDVRAGGRHGGEADGAARVQRFSARRSNVLSLKRASTCFGPGFDVVRIAALEQREERRRRRSGRRCRSGPRCDLSVAAYSPTSCSLARTPTSFSSSANLSGRTSAMKRTPPAGGAAMRTPIASSSGRRSSRPVVASRFTASLQVGS